MVPFQQTLGFTPVANVPYFSSIPCELHRPQESELLQPKQPPYKAFYGSHLCNGHYCRDIGHKNWYARRALLGDHDRALHKLACARAKLRNLSYKPHYNLLLFLRDMKHCTNQVSIWERTLCEYLAMLERPKTWPRPYTFWLNPSSFWDESTDRFPMSLMLYLYSDLRSCLRYYQEDINAYLIVFFQFSFLFSVPFKLPLPQSQSPPQWVF